MTDEKSRGFSDSSKGEGCVVSKMVSLDDKLILIPYTGFGPTVSEGKATQVEDIIVATYNSDKTLTRKYYTYINNTDKVSEIIGLSKTASISGQDERKYVVDVLAAGDKLALLTGKNALSSAAPTTGGSQVAIIDLKDAPTVMPEITEEEITNENGETVTVKTGYAGDVDRSSKVTITSTTATNGNAYSHIIATTAQSTVTVARDTEVPVMTTVYDGVDTTVFTEKGASDVKYTLITDPEAYEGLDLTSIETSGTIYAWPEAEGGKYEVVVEAELKSSPMIKNIVTYEVVVPQDLFVQINNASYSMNAGKYASAGLVAGENTLTVKSNRTFDVDEYYTIVAVYNGSELIACGVSDPTDEAGEATCTFNIPEEDLNKCKFRTFAWTKDLKPL